MGDIRSALMRRREAANLAAVRELAERGDPVASALAEAVVSATTVELTPEFIERFSVAWKDAQATGEAYVQTALMLRVAFETAGFEVLP